MQRQIKIIPNQQIEETYYTNLPVPPTPLIGREQAIKDAQQQLLRSDVRLLTFVGTAGTGKTRLSLQVAAHVTHAFADGVVFISLALINDPTLVIPTIAEVLEVKETVKQSLFDRLKLYLQDKHILLLLDNFEQVIVAASQVAELLAACPHLKLLVTSREVLRIRCEHQFPLSPLALPDLKHLPDSTALSDYGAVTLFVQRAQSVKPHFALTETNATVIAEICTRLDGLPLAIELAAARIKLLSPQSLLAQMNRRLQVLTQGARDLPERQQSLRVTIKWSYDLLNTQEQRLFRWLSAFAGGCTLPTMQFICTVWDGTEDTIQNCVMSLLDKSLLLQIEVDNDEPRFMMLETIREYALEQLESQNELVAARMAHVSYFLAFAEEAEIVLRGGQQTLWLERLEREHENLRTALRWLIEQTDSVEHLEKALRLSSAMWRFWYIRGHFSEGRQWIKSALAASEHVEVSTSARAQALHSAGLLAIYHDRSSEAEILCRESLALYKQLNDQSNIAFLLKSLGMIAWAYARYAEADTLIEESLKISREIDGTDQFQIASGLINLANNALTQGKYDRAYALTEEGLALHRVIGNTWYISFSLNLLAQIVLNQGDYSRTRLLLDESLVLSQQVGYKVGIAFAHYLLAQLVFLQGDIAEARSQAKQGLLIFQQMGIQEEMTISLAFLTVVAALQEEREVAHVYAQESMKIAMILGDKSFIATSLEALGIAYSAQAHYASAVSIWSAADRLRSIIGAPMSAISRIFYARFEQIARIKLGETKFATYWAQGQLLTPEQALAVQYQELISLADQPAKKGLSTFGSSNDLTQREIEVLRLLADGLTNCQIADKLFISPRTINAHLRSIYSKLALTSRTAATRYALDNHLV